MTNLPTLNQIAADPDILTALPFDVLDAVASQADEAKKTADTVRKAVTGVLETRLAGPIAQAYRAKETDTGSVHILAEGFDIEVNRPKKVDWDQKLLAGVVDKIRAAGDDPAEYVKTAYTVDERAYNSWPAFIRSQFEPARTVKTIATTIKMAPAKSEAA